MKLNKEQENAENEMHASLCFDRLFGFSLRFFRGSVSQFSKLNELHRNE